MKSYLGKANINITSPLFISFGKSNLKYIQKQGQNKNKNF